MINFDAWPTNCWRRSSSTARSLRDCYEVMNPTPDGRDLSLSLNRPAECIQQDSERDHRHHDRCPFLDGPTFLHDKASSRRNPSVAEGANRWLRSRTECLSIRSIHLFGASKGYPPLLRTRTRHSSAWLEG